MQLNNFEFNNEENNVVFYHHPCLDGISSAWLVSKHLDNAKYIGINHGAAEDQLSLILDNVSEESIVLFLDFCPPRSILEILVNKVKNIFIYDHHISSMRDVEGFKADNLKSFFDIERSGIGIMWDLLNKKDRPDLINIIEAIDLEKSSIMENSQEFYNIASYIDSIPVADFKKFCLEMDGLSKLSINELSIFGENIRERALDKIEIVINKADIRIMRDIDSFDGDISFAITEGNIFEYGRELTKEFFNLHKELNMVSIWYEDKSEVIRLHIRTRKDLDASLIAQQLSAKYGINGGGHKNSAAVRFKKNMFHKFLLDCQ